MKKREEIQIEDTWNLTDLFSSDSAWEELLTETEGQLSGYREFEGHLGESAETLRRCLELDEQISERLERLHVYGKQKSDEDTGNQKYQDFAARSQALSYKASELSAYIVPEILEIDGEVLEGYCRTDRGLARFRRAIGQILKKKEHTLPAAMEALLAQSYEATQGPAQIFNMFNNADIKFPDITGPDGRKTVLTHGSYIALMECRDRSVRQEAFRALYGTYRQFANTLASTFSANVKQAVFYARAKRYGSSRAYYLAENEIPEEVYDHLLEAVHAFLPALHRYVGIRKRALGLEEIHMYDLYAPMVSREERRIPFGTAKQMVKEGLAPLGEAYAGLLQTGFDNRWIDVYENEGKRSGAYSWGAYGTHPYVLLNYNETLASVFTLAHEMGHALHSYHSDSRQPYIYAGYKIFVAEVASTCNEALLIRHLLSRTEEAEEKRYLLNHFLESFRTTLYRQAMFAEFEAAAHREAEAGGTLTADFLCRTYHKLNQDYFGPEMVVDEEIDYEWSRIPHFYTPFYVYQYATGFSAAVAISSKILSGDEEALKGYFEFLSGGNSMPPIELLKLCGVDMSTPQPVEEALAVFEQLLTEFEVLQKEGKQ